MVATKNEPSLYGPTTTRVGIFCLTMFDVSTDFSVPSKESPAVKFNDFVDGSPTLP